MSKAWDLYIKNKQGKKPTKAEKTEHLHSQKDTAEANEMKCFIKNGNGSTSLWIANHVSRLSPRLVETATHGFIYMAQ